MNEPAAISGLFSQENQFGIGHGDIFFCDGNIGEMDFYVKVKIFMAYAVFGLRYRGSAC